MMCIISFSLGIHFHDMYISAYIVICAIGFIASLIIGAIGSIVVWQLSRKDLSIVRKSSLSDTFAFNDDSGGNIDMEKAEIKDGNV